MQKRHNTELYLASLFALFFIVWVWWPLITLESVNWDDPEYLGANPAITNPGAVWSQFFMGNYHPLTLLSLWGDYLLGAQQHLWIYHVHQFLLHLWVCIGAAWLVWIVSKSWQLAFWIGITFCIHPLRVEPVAWISARKELLSAAFALPALICWVGYLNKRYNYLLYLCILFVVMACLSKATAVILPVLMGILAWNQVRNGKVLIGLSFLGVIAIGFGILAIFAQQEANAIQLNVSFLQRLTLFFSGLSTGLYNFFISMDIHTWYPWPSDPMNTWVIVGVVIVLLAIVAVMFYAEKLEKGKVGLLFFLTSWLPVSQLLPVGQALTADRYWYLPGLGLFWALGLILLFIKPKRVGYLVGLGLILFWGYRTHELIPSWKNGISLFRRMTLESPQTAFAWNNLGVAYATEGQSKLALSCFEKAKWLDPNDSETLINLCGIWIGQGSLTSALPLAEQLVSEHPNLSVSWRLYAEVSLQLGKGKTALNCSREAIKIDPQQALNWAIYGNALQYLKHHALAIMALEKSLQMQPRNIPVIQHLALSEAEIGESKSAIQRLESLLLNNPQNVTLSANYAWVLFRSGNIQKAASTNRSLLNRSNPPAVLWFNQGIYWAAENNLDSAYFAFDQALLQNPGVLLLESTCKDLALIPSELQQPLRKKIGFDASCRN
jgi:tetratricopeptide (TPR) repeat protein